MELRKTEAMKERLMQPCAAGRDMDLSELVMKSAIKASK